MVDLSRMTPLIRSRLLAIASAAAFGGSTVLSKVALEFLPPISLMVVQLLGSLLALWLFVLFTRRPVPLGRKVWQRTLTGVLEPALTFLFFLFGLKLTSAGQASLISTLETVMILALSAVLFRARIERRLLGLALLATLGAVLVVGTTTGSSAFWGNLLVLMGIACAALYVVLNQREIPNLQPVVMVGLQQLVGLLMALIALGLAWRLGEPIMLEPLAWWAWGLLALTGVIQYALAFGLYFTAQRNMPANETALYLTLTPVFGLAGSVMFLGERLNPTQWFGASVIVASIALMAISSSNN
jgi:drug/metabolite transporter (DMT)-like permease